MAKTALGVVQIATRLDEQTEAALNQARAHLAARGTPVTQSQVVRFAILAYAAQLEREHGQ